ncbi:hypothetical protein BRM22_02605 [Xanthomonas oryzae pv. oryzae]|nr:hypothetical protein AZ54_21400 [Xanthomonas oryzae pv. oryzae PXO86]AXM08614.1 hypothetical protein BRM60_03440 [Xanthomonas oryzae pv. oryzae]AXM33775.1 hypothetical protein BRN52_21580 [Xanthomonas oryzae pv. oryzae]QBN85877.1 hypothetical protein EBA17_03730 [Xanthomonas oryzae pv. oryzae]QBO05125.1 hypothetical protein EBA22_03490 [Xanthomonas oryzae pv. oryzae]
MPSPLAGHAVTPSLGLDGGIHAANGSAIGKDTAPDGFLAALLKALHTDQRDRTLPAHRRGT